LKRFLQLALALAVAVGIWFAVREIRARALPPNVPTAVARRGEFLVTVTVRGSLEAQRSVEVIAPRITGLTITWLAPRGSIVQKGEPLARFDSSTARQDLNAKSAALKQAQATLDQAEATARVAEQQDALDLATAQNAVASAELDASKAAILSPIDGDESKLALGMAQEKLKVEQATIAAHQASNGAKIGSAQRLRDKAQADLDHVNLELKQMEVASPITGVITYAMNYSQGWMNAQAFKVGDNIWSGGTLGEIPDLSTLTLLAKVSETDRGKVAVGETIRMHLDALPELTLTGKITAIAALAESDFGATWPPPQVFRVLGTIDKIDPRLRPDMNGNVAVVTQRIPDAIAVPAAAIFTVQGKPVVYTQENGKFVARSVTVVARNPDEVAVSGLAPGATVALTDPTAPATGPAS